MSAITLKGNGRYGGLSGDAKFVGNWERVDSWSKYKITLWNTSAVEIIVEQSPDGDNIDKRSTHQVVAITADPETDPIYESNILRGQIRHPFFRVLVNNPTAVKIDECRVWVQAYQNGHLDAVEDRVGIHAIDKVSGDMTPINLVVDVNGKNRMCVDAEVSIEDIKLTAQTDSITVFGTNEGVPTALAVDANGNLAVDVKVEGITLTPQTDGISIYGTDGTNPVALKSSTLIGEEGQLLIANQSLNRLEVNANAPPSLKFTGSNISCLAGENLSVVIDLGTDENRDRNIVFYGVADVATNTDPKLIMKFSDNYLPPFYGDGGYASFYKHPSPSTKWEFCFQRSNCPLRYVQLYSETPASLDTLRISTSKN